MDRRITCCARFRPPRHSCSRRAKVCCQSGLGRYLCSIQAGWAEQLDESWQVLCFGCFNRELRRGTCSVTTAGTCPQAQLQCWQQGLRALRPGIAAGAAPKDLQATPGQPALCMSTPAPEPGQPTCLAANTLVVARAASTSARRGRAGTPRCKGGQGKAWTAGGHDEMEFLLLGARGKARLMRAKRQGLGCRSATLCSSALGNQGKSHCDVRQLSSSSNASVVQARVLYRSFASVVHRHVFALVPCPHQMVV